jgi:predicted nucleic acid-binding protein
LILLFGLDDYLAGQFFLEATEYTWREAARIYFDLRKQGFTIRSPIDACIAQLAIETKRCCFIETGTLKRSAKYAP